MSYLHGLYLDSFQTTKRHSYDGYSIYIAIFNSFLQVVYPVGVTDLRPYFTQIIGHNSCDHRFHRIPPKLVLEIRLNEPFKCAKFQAQSEHAFVLLWRILQVCEKKKKKKKRRKKNETLAACISEMAGAIFFKFGM